MSTLTEPNWTTNEVLDIDRFGRIHAGSVDRALGDGMLRLDRHDVGVATLVEIAGTLDHNTTGPFLEVMDWFERSESRVVHLDLAALRVVDVMGMRAVETLTGAHSSFTVLVESAALVQLRKLLGHEGGLARSKPAA